jgi:L-seryl-tRNA(Ser) seleniumtransferase
VLDEPRIARFVPVLGAEAVKAHVVAAIDEQRAAFRAGDGDLSGETVVDAAALRLIREAALGLTGVLNGTGVLLHTNLGRAPLAAEALDAIRDVSAGYSNLEFDLEGGERGSRYDRLGGLLRAATGAASSLVVNNCAAAMLLILDTFARGREAIVARNALIEIGGGFRLPDVLARSGATLVEVGATNKVYAADFARALSPNTGVIVRAHPSNYRISGFVADVAPAELAALGRSVGVPVIEDLGTGALFDLRPYGLPYERTVRDAVSDGMDLVAFSGDKLLGGPQAGIIAGAPAAIARLRANPLLRALRVDKATLAALAATLRLHADAATRDRIPLFRMLTAPVETLRERGRALQRQFPALEVVDTEAFTGGGTLPLAPIVSAGVAFAPVIGATAALARLRAAAPPLVARIDAARVVIDLRTIEPADDARVAGALAALFAAN